MSFNLVLSSSDSISYVSGVAQFKVHWAQFNSEAQKYKVSFSFISEVDATLDESDLYTLHLDNIGTTIKSIKGGNTSSSTTTVIGWLKPEEPHSSHARIIAEYNTNTPVDIMGRPDQDIIQISIRDLNGTLSAKTFPFVCILRFEHCGCA